MRTSTRYSRYTTACSLHCAATSTKAMPSNNHHDASWQYALRFSLAHFCSFSTIIILKVVACTLLMPKSLQGVLGSPERE